MRFEKGNKLGGRKPIPPDIKEALKAATPQAVETLIYLSKSSDDDNVRLKAANIIIERELGKPVQPIGNDNTGKLVVEWLEK